MATWGDVEAAEPAFAARVRALLDAQKHKTIATLRADGSPRISGIEAAIADGELTFGSMEGSRNGADLRRDPRFALQATAPAPPEGQESAWSGDAKVAGLAVPAGPVEGMAGDLFRADLREIVITALTPEGDALRIESWSPVGGLRCVERK